MQRMFLPLPWLMVMASAYVPHPLAMVSSVCHDNYTMVCPLIHANPFVQAIGSADQPTDAQQAMPHITSLGNYGLHLVALVLAVGLPDLIGYVIFKVSASSYTQNVIENELPPGSFHTSVAISNAPPYAEIVAIYIRSTWFISHCMIMATAWWLSFLLGLEVGAMITIHAFALTMVITGYQLHTNLTTSIARCYHRAVNMAKKNKQ